MALAQKRFYDQAAAYDTADANTPVDSTHADIAGEGGDMLADAARNIVHLGLAQMAQDDENVRDDCILARSACQAYIIDPIKDIGLVAATSYNDTAAKTTNTTNWNDFLSKDKAAQHALIQFPPGGFFFDDELWWPITDGGPWVSGAGGISGSYEESHYYGHDLVDDWTGPWPAIKTRFLWAGDTATDHKAFIHLRGRGQGLSRLYIDGQPTFSGGTSGKRAVAPASGPDCGVFCSDTWASIGTGFAMFREVTVFGCKIGIQLGSQRQWEDLAGGSIFSTGTSVSVPGHNLRKNTIIKFHDDESTPTAGTLPTELDDDTAYHVVESTRDTLKISATRDGTPLTWTPGGSGNVGIRLYGDTAESDISNSDQTDTSCLAIHACQTAVAAYNTNSIGSKFGHVYVLRCAETAYIWRGEMLFEVLDINELAVGATDHQVVRTSKDIQRSTAFVVGRLRLDDSIYNKVQLVNQDDNITNDSGRFAGARFRFDQVEQAYSGDVVARTVPLATLMGNARLMISDMEYMEKGCIQTHDFTYASTSDPSILANPDPADSCKPTVMLDRCMFYESVDPAASASDVIDHPNSTGKVSVSMVACHDIYGNWIGTNGIDIRTTTIV